jgi:hypothetical protein
VPYASATRLSAPSRIGPPSCKPPKLEARTGSGGLVLQVSLYLSTVSACWRDLPIWRLALAAVAALKISATRRSC